MNKMYKDLYSIDISKMQNQDILHSLTVSMLFVSFFIFILSIVLSLRIKNKNFQKIIGKIFSINLIFMIICFISILIFTVIGFFKVTEEEKIKIWVDQNYSNIFYEGKMIKENDLNKINELRKNKCGYSNTNFQYDLSDKTYIIYREEPSFPSDMNKDVLEKLKNYSQYYNNVIQKCTLFNYKER